jgi:hypothetical protein
MPQRTKKTKLGPPLDESRVSISFFNMPKALRMRAWCKLQNEKVIPTFENDRRDLTNGRNRLLGEIYTLLKFAGAKPNAVSAKR